MKKRLPMPTNIKAVAWAEEALALQGRLDRIAEIIWDVDNRCLAADGPVTATLEEMRQSELSEIYKLATGNSRKQKRRIKHETHSNRLQSTIERLKPR